MKPIRVLVHGAQGRMGREVLAAVCGDQELRAVAAVEQVVKQEWLPLPDGSGSIPFSADLESAIRNSSPDVLVDFTTAEATMAAVSTAVKHHLGLVIGTTGLSPAALSEIDSLCQAHRVGAIAAPNFSLGAAILIHLAKIAARFFDYAEVIEMHHEQKADAPSGTAVSTARDMVKARGQPFCHSPAQKETLPGSRGAEFEGVALHSVRMPGLLAHQEVMLGAPGQTLTIRHDQISREAYMPGVILAIKRVVNLRELVVGLDTLLGL